MTEKRFDVGNLKIQDNAPKGRIYLLDMQGGVNALCSLINGLNDKSNRLEKENEQLKQVLGAILFEVKRDITNINQTGEIRVFINPNSFNLISKVLRKYGGLKR